MEEAIPLKGQQYLITIEDCQKFFRMSETYFIELFKQNPIHRKTGVTFHEYTYLITEFIRRNKSILDKFNKNMLSNYINVIEYKYGDFEYVNNTDILLEEQPQYPIELNLHPDLKQALYENIPSHYSNLERIFYLYFKLCFLLSYSEEFFIEDHRTKEGIKRQANVKRLEEITPQNNEVVCYEFAQIINQLIHEEGHLVKFDGGIYGYDNQHSTTNAIIEKYMIELDAVTGVLSGDIINLKLNHGFKGIYSYNSCEKTSEEIYQLARNIYHDIQKEFHSTNTHEKYGAQRLHQIINEIDQWNISEKEKCYLQKYCISLNHTNLTKMDFAAFSISTMKRLRKDSNINTIHLEIVGVSKETLHIAGIVSILDHTKQSQYIYFDDQEIYHLDESTLCQNLLNDKIIPLWNQKKENILATKSQNLKIKVKK